MWTPRLLSCLLALVWISSVKAQTLGDLLEQTAELSELVKLIKANNSVILNITLQLDSLNMTVFAPNNQAVAAFKTMYPGAEENAALVRDVLTYHLLVNTTVRAADIQSNMKAYTAFGSPIWFHKTSEAVTVNDATVVTPDINATNGVVHIINEVLYPLGVNASIGDAVLSNADFSGLKALVERAPNVASILTNSTQMATVFAPTNMAIPSTEGLSNTNIEAVLNRHIGFGKVIFAEYFNRDGRLETYNEDIITKQMNGNVYVKNSEDLWSKVVSRGGLATLNGVVHRINGVLGLKPGANLVETLGLLDLSRVKSGIMQENLAAVLEDISQNYTIFAMSNVAYESAEGSLERYIVKGNIFSTDLSTAQTVQTLNNDSITVTKNLGKVVVKYKSRTANVISKDKRASNGVIHVIDADLSGAASFTLSAALTLSIIVTLFLS